MPRPNPARPLLAAVVLALCAQPATSEPIRWDYSTFVFPGFVTPDVGGGAPNAYSPVGVTFVGTSGQMAGSSPVVFANLWTEGWLQQGQTATFKHQPVQMAMGILDRTSNRSDLAFFTAYLDGTVSNQGANLGLSFAESTKTLHVGHTLYKIDLGAIVLPGAHGGPGGATAPVRPWPGNSGIGAIAATVSVRKNPEPSTLLLLGMGGSLAAALYCRRRGRHRPGHRAG